MAFSRSGISRFERLDEAVEILVSGLLSERNAAGHWRGELSTSALSTATASVALGLAAEAPSVSRSRAAAWSAFACGGLDWLAAHQNDDGGFGDTTRSASNLSTTTLAWAALRAGAPPERGPSPSHREAIGRAEGWIREHAGSTEPDELARKIVASYGKDRTFSVPILTHCALCGVLGQGDAAWRHVIPLPFELAVLPRRWFGRIGLPVVSYALPALIAIGLARFEGARPRNPLSRLARRWARPRALRVLDEIQPRNGGFLEATPLTSFVAMSLIASGLESHPVAERCLEFLVRSRRADGSWPIDTDLATWVTTLAVHALESCDTLESALSVSDRSSIREWLLEEQYSTLHPYTCAAPGAWAWTDLPGGVPDADDTPGALLALKSLGEDPRSEAAAFAGVGWLLDLQNRDGGIPTFCRGWGKLPFDRSAPDLTAHALRAWLAWRAPLARRGAVSVAKLRRALDAALQYLAQSQRESGEWIPLWFGNESAPELANPTYGTAKVAVALEAAEHAGFPAVRALRDRAVRWLLSRQTAAGGWGGDAGIRPTIEETGLVLEALAAEDLATRHGGLVEAVRRGTDWIAREILAGTHREATPIGFYFAKLWYFEKLYPIVFALAGLGRARKLLASLDTE